MIPGSLFPSGLVSASSWTACKCRSTSSGDGDLAFPRRPRRFGLFTPAGRDELGAEAVDRVAALVVVEVVAELSEGASGLAVDRVLRRCLVVRVVGSSCGGVGGTPDCSC